MANEKFTIGGVTWNLTRVPSDGARLAIRSMVEHMYRSYQMTPAQDRTWHDLFVYHQGKEIAVDVTAAIGSRAHAGWTDYTSKYPQGVPNRTDGAIVDRQNLHISLREAYGYFLQNGGADLRV